MIFKISSTSDDRVQKAYEEAMASLNDFWGIDWTSMTPNIYIVESRKDMDLLWGKETEPWFVAFAAGNQPGDRRVHIFDYDKFATESSWQITEEAYKTLLKHEICHLFTMIVSKGRNIPSWLNEGLSIYLSGQLKLGRTKPQSFTRFLSGNIKDSYDEGGFVVELLTTKFGKDKMIKFVSTMPEVRSAEDFQRIFKEIFEIDLNYDSINALDDGLRSAQADVAQFGNLSIPMNLRNAPTKLMKSLGYGSGYEMYSKEDLLPEKLKGKKYFQK